MPSLSIYSRLNMHPSLMVWRDGRFLYHILRHETDPEQHISIYFLGKACNQAYYRYQTQITIPVVCGVTTCLVSAVAGDT